MSMRVLLRWENDSEDLLERCNELSMEMLPISWDDEMEEALLHFHSGLHSHAHPELELDSLFAFSEHVDARREGRLREINWVEADDMLAAARRLQDHLSRRTPEARVIVLSFVRDRIWEAERKKARWEHRNLDFNPDDIDLTGRPTDEDWTFLIEVLEGFQIQIEAAMALGAKRVTIEYS